MKKILIVTEAGDSWPSGVVRALSFSELFNKAGYEVCYCSRCSSKLTKFIDNPLGINKILLKIFRKQINQICSYVAKQNIKRIIKIAPNFDTVYLQKVDSFQLVNALTKIPGLYVTYDLNDALWLPSFSKFAQGKIKEILKIVNAVTCDNPYGREFALQYNKNSFVVPDTPDLELFDIYRGSIVTKSSDKITIGWIGSPGTLYNLFLIWESLEQVFRKYSNITFRIIGAGYDSAKLPPFENVIYTTLPYYNKEQMIGEILTMDIGLFPMFNVEASIVRGILKSTIYMSGAVPVIASPVGQINEFINDGENGMIACSTGEWIEKISLLLENMSLRKTIGQAGLNTVRKNYTKEKIFNQLCAVLTGSH